MSNRVRNKPCNIIANHLYTYKAQRNMMMIDKIGANNLVVISERVNSRGYFLHVVGMRGKQTKDGLGCLL